MGENRQANQLWAKRDLGEFVPLETQQEIAASSGSGEHMEESVCRREGEGDKGDVGSKTMQQSQKT